MSIEALKWAFEQEDVPPGPRFVLVALANRANEEGGDLYPSLGWVKRKTGIPLRTIRQYMTDLQARGLLLKTERRRDDGGRTSNEYQLPLTQPGLRFDPPAATAVGGDTAADTPRQPPPGAPAATAGHETKELNTPSSSGKRIPEGFAISDVVRRWAVKRGWSAYLDAHLEYFVDYCRTGDRKTGKPILALDWDAKFRTAITSDWGDVRKNIERVQFKPGQKPPNGAARPGEPWYITWTGIVNEALRRGITKGEHEIEADFADRVFATAGVTRERAAKDRLEWRGEK